MGKQEGRCGPSWGGRCNKHLAYWAIYCNEWSGWCGTTGAHKDAQSSDKYDWNPSSMLASSGAVGVVLLEPTKMPSRVTNTIGIHRQCLHRVERLVWYYWSPQRCPVE